MKLPAELAKTPEWTLIGPMGPRLPKFLESHPLIAVDGGGNFCDHSDIWIGDGDSSFKDPKAKHIFQFPPKKSLSDLALALSLLPTTHPLTLHCWGFLGGRRDHELLNLGEVLRFLEFREGSQVYFYDGVSGQRSVKCFSSGTWHLRHVGLFSVAALRAIRIKLEGDCEYTIGQFTELPPLSTLGLSNEARGEFCLTNDGPVMILIPESY